MARAKAEGEERRARMEQPVTERTVTERPVAAERIEAIAREEGRTFEEIQEEIRTGTRQVPRGKVLVHTRVIEEPVEQDVTIRQREVDVERRAVSRPATPEEREMLGKAGEETYEFTEMTEEPIISKEARVVGEVEVDEEITEHPERVRGTVRRREVEVERTGEGREMREGRQTRETRVAFDDFDSAFRRHFDSTYGTRGVSYDTYRPAYRYGFDLATSSRYRDQNWSDIESDVRSRWEDRNPGTWNDYKDAIHEGWRQAQSVREKEPML
jgi:stress response protein YsnF